MWVLKNQYMAVCFNLLRCFLHVEFGEFALTCVSGRRENEKRKSGNGNENENEKRETRNGIS